MIFDRVKNKIRKRNYYKRIKILENVTHIEDIEADLAPALTQEESARIPERDTDDITTPEAPAQDQDQTVTERSAQTIATAEKKALLLPITKEGDPQALVRTKEIINTTEELIKKPKGQIPRIIITKKRKI